MQSTNRIDRYGAFIASEYVAGLSKGDEFSLESLTPALRATLRRGIDTIVFSGMGCSAIVSDLFAGFFEDLGLPVDVHVVNDYDFRGAVSERVLESPSTLLIVSSYSGYSQETLLAFEQLKVWSDRLLLLTSGGELARKGREVGVSIAYWKLSNPDREYPLFHVSQYFAILTSIFCEFGVLAEEQVPDFELLAAEILAARPKVAERGRLVAECNVDADFLLIATPRWFSAMLKLAKMHLNEIAMVPASRNLFNEFCHSEIATLSDPTRPHCVLAFVDAEDDDYVKAKADTLVTILSEPVAQNESVDIQRVDLIGTTFLARLFIGLDFVQHLTLALARAHDTASRDLISRAAGNPWYHSATIEAELSGAA